MMQYGRCSRISVRVTTWGHTVGWSPEDQWEREEREVLDWEVIGKERGEWEEVRELGVP